MFIHNTSSVLSTSMYLNPCVFVSPSLTSSSLRVTAIATTGGGRGYSSWVGGRCGTLEGKKGLFATEGPYRCRGTRMLNRMVKVLQDPLLVNQVHFYTRPTEIFGRNQSSEVINCWYCGSSHSCQQPANTFFCNHCGLVQPPSCAHCTLFDFFSLSPSFEIDNQELHEKFRQLQRKLHPDKFTQKSEKERKFSQDQSSTINNAFKILSNDLLRAQYLLKLNGEDVLSEGKSLIDPDLLTEVLEVREDLDNSHNIEDVKKIGDHNLKKYEGVVSELKKNFKEEDFDSAKKNTIFLQYLSKIKEEVESRLLKMPIVNK